MNQLFLLSFIILFGFTQAQFYGYDYVARRGSTWPGTCPTEEEVYADLAAMKLYGNRVRLYNLYDCEGGMKVAKAANKLGMELYLGMQNAPAETLGWEKSILLDIINAYGYSNILGVSVGCESLWRGDMPAHLVAQAILEVKDFVNENGWKFPMGIGYADNYELAATKTNYSLVRDASDTLIFNLFSYYGGGYPTSRTDAAPATSIINQVKGYQTRWPNKLVILGESGWPTNSTSSRAPIKGNLLQQYTAETLVCECHKNNILFFWFQSHDLPWKYSNPSNPERSWGLWTDDRRWKHPGWTWSCPNYPYTPTYPTTTAAPTTTVAPTTTLPPTTTAAPTTTLAPTTLAPTTVAPTVAPVTEAPTTQQVNTVSEVVEESNTGLVNENTESESLAVNTGESGQQNQIGSAVSSAFISVPALAITLSLVSLLI